MADKFGQDTAPPTDWWQTQSSGQDWQQTQQQAPPDQQGQQSSNQQQGNPAEILDKLKQLLGNDWSTENIRKNIDAIKGLGIEVQNQERGDFRPRFRLPNGDVWDYGPGGWVSRGQMGPGFSEQGSGGLQDKAGQKPGGNSSISDFFHSMPGYQFGLEEGLKGIERSQFARGTGLTGGALKELARYAGGYADQAYGDWVDRFMRASKMGQDAADQGSS